MNPVRDHAGGNTKEKNMDMNYGQSQHAVPAAAYAGQQAQAKTLAGGQIAPVPNRDSEAMFHELGNRFGHLGELIARLEALTDRACGPVPQDPKVQGGMHSPNNLSEKIGCSVQVVTEANARISAALNRLESFV